MSITVPRWLKYIDVEWTAFKVVRIKIDRGKKTLTTPAEQKGVYEVETIAVRRLKQLLEQCKDELEEAKLRNAELEQSITELATQLSTQQQDASWMLSRHLKLFIFVAHETDL